MKLYFLIFIAFISNTAFAVTMNHHALHAEVANKVSQAWKRSQAQAAKLDRTDMLMVYGGEDVTDISMQKKPAATS